MVFENTLVVVAPVIKIPPTALDAPDVEKVLIALPLMLMTVEVLALAIPNT